MKLQELYEAAAKDQILQIVQIPLAQARTIFERGCSNAKWMVKQNLPLWKGISMPITDEACIIDTTLSKRRSQNTRNFYTEILDSSPHFSDWPKRSKSLICTNDIHYARQFARSADDKNLYAVIPFNEANIAGAETQDIWDVEFSPFGCEHYTTLPSFNSRLGFCVSGDSIDDIKLFGEKLAVRDEKAMQDFEDNFQKSAESQHVLDNFMTSLYDNLKPSDLGFEKFRSSSVMSALPDSEIWVEGKVLLIPFKMWNRFRSTFDSLIKNDYHF